jgi:dethiobiotin synthetase
MTAMFVTATGTDVGKTFVARGLIRALRARGGKVAALKPIVSGFDPKLAARSDPGLLLDALGEAATPDTIARMSPWRFAAPLSPDLAARAEGRQIDFAALIAFCRARMVSRADALVIEGVGGIMVPLDDRHTVLDWMIALELPLVVVAGSYLGTISHTLSALDVLARRNLAIAAVVVSETPGSRVPLADTVATITRLAPSLEVFALPHLPGQFPDHPVFQAILRAASSGAAASP